MFRKTAIIAHLRLPAPCVLCYTFHRGPFAVCAPCETLLKPLSNPCQYCGIPLMNDTFPTCGHCIKKRPHYDRVLSAYPFAEPLRTLLHDFKYQHALYLRTFLVKLMLAAVPQDYYSDCLVPVPLHPQRLRQRGFNQAAELAKLLAKHCRLPYSLTLCQKIINTPQQVGLAAEARRKNLHQSFRVQASPYQHITLIDDLITTGSTVNELAKRFKQQGVKQVDVWCCARA